MSAGGRNIYIFYCLNDKKCSYVHHDGENSFLFVYDKDKTMVIPPYLDNDIEALKTQCYQTEAEKRRHYAALIEANGWKIPDDYPWL